MTLLSKIASGWDSFEGWVYSWMPGFKTRVATGLGAVGSAAGMLQGYVTGLPLDKFASATQIAVATSVLFTLAYWFHGMSERQGD